VLHGSPHSFWYIVHDLDEGPNVWYMLSSITYDINILNDSISVEKLINPRSVVLPKDHEIDKHIMVTQEELMISYH
jgi:hypothetical protein